MQNIYFCIWKTICFAQVYVFAYAKAYTLYKTYSFAYAKYIVLLMYMVLHAALSAFAITLLAPRAGVRLYRNH